MLALLKGSVNQCRVSSSSRILRLSNHLHSKIPNSSRLLVPYKLCYPRWGQVQKTLRGAFLSKQTRELCSFIIVFNPSSFASLFFFFFFFFSGQASVRSISSAASSLESKSSKGGRMINLYYVPFPFFFFSFFLALFFCYGEVPCIFTFL